MISASVAASMPHYLFVAGSGLVGLETEETVTNAALTARKVIIYAFRAWTGSQ
jgi:hypothetical protein